MLGEALRTHLLSDSTLQGLIGQRVHPAMLPQKSVLPAITYQVVSADTNHTLEHRVALTRPRVQFDVYAATYLDMEQTNDALRAALDGFKGQMGGSPGLYVQGAFLETERDLFESEPELFRRSADYFIWVEQ